MEIRTGIHVEIGFTGTQQGMSEGQKGQLRDLLVSLKAQAPHFRFRHGDCIGADAEAHDIVLALGQEITIHPPLDPKKRALRAFKEGPGVTVLYPEPYLVRNHRIVDACSLLIAAPFGVERLRSGTWATVRYARATGKPFLVLDFGS